MRRVGTQMAGAIGIVGLLLTVIGLYGIVSYLVRSRTAELAVRIALGASSGQLFREVLGHAARLVGGGLVVGAGLSLLITPMLTVFLAGLSSVDPTAYLLAAAALVVVALAATYLPARAVTSVDPSEALRER